MTPEQMIAALVAEFAKGNSSDLYRQVVKIVNNCMAANLDAKGVLTKANFGSLFQTDSDVYHRLADTTYESAKKVRDGG